METNDFHSASRRRLRLAPLPLSDLPAHPLLASQQSTASPSLRSFITEVLSEAIAFSDTIVPTQFKRKGSPKSSSPSTAQVQLLTCDDLKAVGTSKGSDTSKTEAWFARQSTHVDRAEAGTASWEEFVDGLMREHSVHEMEYTPDVYDAHKVLDWREEIGVLDGEGWEKGWREVAMEVYEMAHNIPLLDNRVFGVLVVRALTPSSSSSIPTTSDTAFSSQSSTSSFVVAQLPLLLSSIPSAPYASGSHRTTGSTSQQRSAITLGQYVSIERVKRLEDGKIWWEMATASDAKGNLPMAVQKMGVPGAVVKDVGFFIKWVGERRRSGR